MRKLGHFSQLVWKDTTELGFGKKSGTYTDSKRRTWTCTYYVARYKAAGNVMSQRQFRENVDEGSFNRSRYCKAVKADRRPWVTTIYPATSLVKLSHVSYKKLWSLYWINSSGWNQLSLSYITKILVEFVLSTGTLSFKWYDNEKIS